MPPTDTAVPDEVDEVRAFNRAYTRQLGLLDRSYLKSGLGLSEVRVLYEVAHGARTARGIATALGLDAGYLSRTIRSFERRGWVARERGEGDGRQRSLALTGAGRSAAAAFEEMSRAEVSARIARLDPAARDGLLRGMRHIGAAFSEPPPGVALRRLAPGDAGWVIGRHGALYAADEGYDATFEALVAGIVAAFMGQHDPAREGGWIAWHGARRAGSVFVVRDDDATARLRLFLLERWMRGQGLGRRMLDHALGFARDAGYRRMTLWTHESHRAACALYAASGFALVRARQAHSFGHDVVEQEWERAL